MESKVKEAFGTLIRESRKEKNISQQNLAKLVGSSQGNISKIEHGVSIPDVLTWIKLCKVLKISNEDLITIEDVKIYLSSSNEVPID